MERNQVAFHTRTACIEGTGHYRWQSFKRSYRLKMNDAFQLVSDKKTGKLTLRQDGIDYIKDAHIYWAIEDKLEVFNDERKVVFDVLPKEVIQQAQAMPAPEPVPAEVKTHIGVEILKMLDKDTGKTTVKIAEVTAVLCGLYKNLHSEMKKEGMDDSAILAIVDEFMLETVNMFNKMKGGNKI